MTPREVLDRIVFDTMRNGDFADRIKERGEIVKDIETAIREAVLAERERAAKLCEANGQGAGYVLAALIRAGLDSPKESV